MNLQWLFNSNNTSRKSSLHHTDRGRETQQEVVRQISHHNSQNAFVTMRSRSDILIAVAFLTTRLSCPDVDDIYKLMWVIQYIRGNGDLYLILEPQYHNVYRWWIDASFAVHPNMRSHTGTTMSNGAECVVSLSSK